MARRSSRRCLWLMAALVTACSFDASRLRAPASRGRDGAADYPSAPEASGAGGDGDLADLDGAGGSPGTEAGGPGAPDALVAVDQGGAQGDAQGGAQGDAPSTADAASAPDSPAALDGAGATDSPATTEPDTTIDQGGGAEAGEAETAGAGGTGGSGGTTGTGTGGTSSEGGAGGTLATGGATSGGTGGMGGAGGSATWDGSPPESGGTTGSGGTGGSTGAGGSGGTPVTYHRLVPQSLTTSSLEVVDGATTNGTQVQMATTAPVDKQAFALLDAGSGNVTIAMKANNAKCLGPVDNSTANYTLLEVQDCNGTSYQAFTQITNPGKPGFWFKNVRAGRCIDVKGGGLTNGALVQILDCNTHATSYNQYLQPQAM